MQIQGLGVVYREDPEKNFTGSLRYINSTIHCVPTDIQLPSPPFTTNSLVDVSPPGILTPPPSSASESDIAVLIPGARRGSSENGLDPVLKGVNCGVCEGMKSSLPAYIFIHST